MVTWERLGKRPSSGHLVTGEHEVDRVDRAKLLQRLMVALRMKGDWALRVGRDRGRVIVQVVFENEDDALRFGDTLGARPVRRYLGWATQQEFQFTSEIAERLRKALMLT